MKINGPNSLGAVNKYKQTLESQRSVASSKQAKKRDQVEISSEAKELLGTNAAGTSPEKMESLKSSVAAGTYKVDARTLAEKIFPFIKG
ncbi:flagellar biosynthesis anti-sigma factor FlgM [Paenibacillus cremeus]|uniref:Negative regulator of flagellin synthesis n=1 Tax=Paenibacillus cremeus TaxID=2163881 RepID=A0A559KB25_9BACL|nr:flagellar biosynthesis anti-sigma factor FlgM [Paenibacillus cremeus]TVY09331.1 flagellar biosynthesis anti-sigma factor FlgM [Paenibacillus cremeus]